MNVRDGSPPLVEKRLSFGQGSPSPSARAGRLEMESAYCHNSRIGRALLLL